LPFKEGKAVVLDSLEAVTMVMAAWGETTHWAALEQLVVLLMALEVARLILVVVAAAAAQEPLLVLIRGKAERLVATYRQ
jgi:hypothetical protein